MLCGEVCQGTHKRREVTGLSRVVICTVKLGKPASGRAKRVVLSGSQGQAGVVGVEAAIGGRDDGNEEEEEARRQWKSHLGSRNNGHWALTDI